jgi:hypothetical protein
MPRDEKLRHFFPVGVTTSKPFTPPFSPRSNSPRYPNRSDPAAHARKLLAELAATQQAIANLPDERRQELLADCAGSFIDVDFVPNPDFDLKSLEDAGAGIELVAVSDVDAGVSQATLYVPDGKLTVFERKISAFAPTGPQTQSRNKPLVSSLEAIRQSVAESFWTDPLAPFPETSGEHWWEVWIRKAVDPERFKRHAQVLGLHVANRNLKFPDRTVFLVRASVAAMTRSAQLLDSIAELRRATPLDLELIGLDGRGESIIGGDLATRLLRAPSASPAVTLLDTGVDHAHPLLERALPSEDVHTCFGEDTRDQYAGGDWHGTGSAGLALFGNDLANAVASTENWQHTHHLESVKFIPSSSANDPDLYGEVTKEAVALVEIAKPNRARTFVSTATADASPLGEPTSWSAAVDQLSSGYDDGVRRLIVLSAGNVIPASDHAHPRTNYEALVEDPAQAWNALAVGAYTERTAIVEPDFAGHAPVAPVGDLSPSSRTTIGWIKALGVPPPFKPDCVCEGGNWATDGGVPDLIDSLTLLTTRRRDASARLFGRFAGTSAAASLAANTAARLQAEYPQLWPETLRALLVHSCRYTPAMARAFSGQTPRDRAECMVRCFGYGVPDLDRARYSARNELTFVIEQEIQPYRFDAETRKGKMNEMHVHRLPWPADLLEESGELDMRLRVTLSYFVQPNPGRRGVASARTKLLDSARYPSFGLRFDVTKAGESVEALVARVNAAAREDVEYTTTGDLNEWTIGQRRTRGSIHSDVWTGTAVKLADKGGIVVFPLRGWWRFRRDREVCEQKGRYALIISIETDEVDVDLYSAVQTLVPVST